MEENNINIMRQKIYLAALLHDIGKFYQRADNKKNDGRFDFLEADFWNKPETYCPKNQNNYYTHKHVIWTAQFIQENANIFNNLGINAKDRKDSLTLLAASHHNPSSDFEKIIQLADWYSSGVDRTLDEYLIDDGFEDNWDLFKKRRMVSIFEDIDISKEQTRNEKKSEDYKYLLPVEELKLDKSFFPKPTTELKNNIPDYKTLWTSFEEDFKNIPATSFKVFAETLLSLLYKYTASVPSSTNHLPDVSLFDHAKTTAAFALAIYDFYTENKRLPTKEDTIINLIGADISGIQKFIYDIVSKNAAKNLKGRSFYLQLMTDSIIQYMLKELNLYSANIVYSSGGGFFIIAPNTKDFKEKLIKIEEHISKKLFEAHKTTLFVAISSIPMSEKTLLPEKHNTNIKKEGLGEKWSKLMQKLNTKKRQRYADKLVDNYKNFFEPTEQGGENKYNRDSITGDEFSKNEKVKKIKDGSLVSKQTWEQIELGKKLKNAEYWIISDNNIDTLIGSKGFNTLELGFYHYFVSEEKAKEIPENLIIRKINETDFFRDGKNYNDKKYALGFSFYGGNDFPEDEDGSPKTFDELVGDEDAGFKRLGILRMDVDNLGQIFINGMSERKRTFSRYSTLSRNLNYFFTGYLNKIQQQTKYKDLTYILYSGGDDLFILGKWDFLINMAKEIKDDFAEWTCYNPNISLSGGIAIVTPKFPIMKAADLAGSEEKNAKEYKNGNLEKNAFSLWNYSLSWKEGYEFDVVSDLKAKILLLLEKGKLPKSFIGNISGFHAQWKIQTEKKQNESWQWQMAYQIARFAKEQKDYDVEKLLNEIKIDVFTDTYKGKPHKFQYRFIELLNIASRWAELELRTNKIKN